MKNEQSKKKSIIIILLAILIVIGLAFSAFLINSQKESTASETEISEPETAENDEYADLRTLYESHKQINPDYVGEIYFESGLISEPFVQGETNDTYLRKNYEDGSYSEMGTVFMDYRSSLDDQNIIIYGHYVYSSLDPSGTSMFTPLSRLISQENYEANRYVDLLLDGEIRRYEIVAVFYCELSDDENVIKDDLNYYYLGFDEDFFEKYKASILRNEFYDTGVDFSIDDHYLTLQTCVENHDELREIVLAKEIERIDITK